MEVTRLVGRGRGHRRWLAKDRAIGEQSMRLEEPSYAGEKIERWGSAGTIEERERLEPGKRETAPRISVQGLCGGVREHDAGGAGGGVDEPSSGMVQCVEQSGDRLEHAQ